MAKGLTEYLSIGDICDETGLSPDVIRVWERRYGFPVPVRLPSGHRRYRPEDLNRLRLMAEAVAQGLRPSVAAAADDTALKGMLRKEEGEVWTDLVDGLFDSVMRMDAVGIRAQLDQARARDGVLPFLRCCVAPLLDRVGMAWAEGTLDIHQEHFLTEVLEDRLRQLRAEQRVQPGSPVILFATLPGERHRLGLLMAALTYAAKGHRTELLGIDLPVANIASAARTLKASCVAVSLSIQSSGEPTRRLIQDLQERLPDGCRLIIGGQGAARTRRVEGVERMAGLDLKSA
ncbi:MAG TPA: MerR family transcriptional regulator [Holophagaceae bacterium]|nr:MerR family transcriptional regulator [Holophagaceae bacterium]